MLTDTYLGGMSKTNKNGGSPKGSPSSVSSPSVEQVREWVKQDFESAHYLLGLILKRHPEIVGEIADLVYYTVNEKEKGSGIDHVEKELKEELHND